MGTVLNVLRAQGSKHPSHLTLRVAYATFSNAGKSSWIREETFSLRALLHSRRAAGQTLAAVSGEIATNQELREAWHRGLAGTLTARMQTILRRAIDRGELQQALWHHARG
jgi:hypothetical protein